LSRSDHAAHLTTRPADRTSWADDFAAVVLDNLTRRYPYDAHHETRGDDDRALPRELHPAFGTSYDWHSCVHMHWLGARLLAFGVDDELAARLQVVLAENLTAENLRVEAAYLAAHTHYERPYGWAWAMRLAAELATSPVAALRALAPGTTPLVSTIEQLTMPWIRKAAAPVRHGVHANSAFGLALIIEAARSLALPALDSACSDAARHWFLGDRDWPADWERSGQDFLSPGLAEADLMRLVLPAADFASWCLGFLGNVRADSPFFAPAVVVDESDVSQVHLFGLNVHRAGAGTRVAEVLQAQPGAPADLGRRLVANAPQLLAAGVAAAVSDEFYSTHWLATFAWDAMESVEGHSDLERSSAR
jgi:hypothetical protein